MTSTNPRTDSTSVPDTQPTGSRPLQRREDGQAKVHCYTIGCKGALVNFAGDKYPKESLGKVLVDPPELRSIAARARPGMVALEKDDLRRGDTLLLWNLTDVFSTYRDLSETLGAWLRRGVAVWVVKLARLLNDGDLLLLRAATFSQRTRRGQGYWRLPPNPRRFVGYGLRAKYNRSKREYSFRHDAGARSTQAMILSYWKLNWSTREIATALNISGIRAWGRVSHNSGLARNNRVRWTPQRVAIAYYRELELREFERNPSAYERALQKDADRLP